MKEYVKPSFFQVFIDKDILADCQATAMATSKDEAEGFEYLGGSTVYIVNTNGDGPDGKHYKATVPCTGTKFYLKFSHSNGSWDYCTGTTQCEYNYAGETTVKYRCSLDDSWSDLNLEEFTPAPPNN